MSLLSYILRWNFIDISAESNGPADGSNGAPAMTLLGTKASKLMGVENDLISKINELINKGKMNLNWLGNDLFHL
jgi:hypothetical protein